MANHQSNQRSNNPFKWAALTVGTLFGVAHIGVLGHLMNRTDLPVINLPVGDYTSYKVEAGKEGYKIEYNSNDPKVMSIDKHVDKRPGFLGIGGKTFIVTKEEYTMDGIRHLGGDDVGKLSAKDAECIKAEGGGENAGRQVGATLGAAVAPSVMSVPYIGWLAAGWVAMFSQDKGSEIGGDIATMMKDCE